ncbi:MAG: ABC transporter substrate-binding protein [Alphaproteobacteria bacterium]
MKLRSFLFGAAALAAFAAPVSAQQMPKVVIAISGWTGFAPLTLAEQTGLFKKHGVDVEIKFIAQKERHLAIQAGSVQGAATTIDTFVVWNAAGVKLTQVLLLDKSNGADGIATRNSINKISDLKGKTIAVDGPGTTPYFTMVNILKKNGLTVKDITLSTLAPQPAANAFVAGQFDAAVTYEPYISIIRNKPESGKILATTKDYPVVVDTLAFQPDYIAKNPKIVQGVVNGFFDALDMIKKDPTKSYEIMGAKVKQNAEQFGKSASFIAWQDKAANQAYFAKEMMDFLKFATEIQLEAGVIKAAPDLNAMVNANFIK